MILTWKFWLSLFATYTRTNVDVSVGQVPKQTQQTQTALQPEAQPILPPKPPSNWQPTPGTGTCCLYFESKARRPLESSMH